MCVGARRARARRAINKIPEHYEKGVCQTLRHALAYCHAWAWGAWMGGLLDAGACVLACMSLHWWLALVFGVMRATFYLSQPGVGGGGFIALLTTRSGLMVPYVRFGSC